MKQELINVGAIVNAHGIRGEVKLNPVGFDPEFLAEFDRDMLDWFYSDDWIIWDSEEECLERPVSYDV